MKFIVQQYVGTTIVAEKKFRTEKSAYKWIYAHLQVGVEFDLVRI